MAKIEDYKLLISRSALFNGISSEEIDELLSCLDVRLHTYQKGSFVFLAGQSLAAMGLLLSGQLDILQDDVWGNRRILERISVGKPFGTAFSCAQLERIPVSVMATKTSDALLFDYQKVVTTCVSACPFHTRLISNMINTLAQRNIYMMQKIESITRKSTRDKVLAFLSQQSQDHQAKSFNIPFNRQELAEYLAVDRSALSTELGRLRDEGVLRFSKNHFELLG